MKIFLDAYAMIEICEGNSNYDAYVDMDSITSYNNLAELYYFMLLAYDEHLALESMQRFLDCAIGVTPDIIADAMKFRFRHKKTRFSYIDCLGYYLAKKNNCKFLTGDRAFGKMEDAIIVR